MTKIFLIRHGEVYNPNDIEYIRLPGFKLSERGVKQVEKLRKVFIEKNNISIIYSSPLRRTKETSKILSNGQIPIRYADELIESNYKKWQGLKRDERKKEDIEAFRKDPIKFSATLGESLLCIQKRVVDKIFDIVEKHQGQNVALVFHADPILTARLFFEERPLSELMSLSVKHASVTSIIFDNKLKCKKVEYNEYVEAEGWRV